MRLTDESIRRAKRPTSGQQLLWDDLLSGFGIRLTPNAASFVIQWRDPNGKKPRESLRPRWPHLSVLKARDLARKRLSQVAVLKEQGGTMELRHAMRTWYERKSETANWRPKYRSKVDALIRDARQRGNPDQRRCALAGGTAAGAASFARFDP